MPKSGAGVPKRIWRNERAQKWIAELPNGEIWELHDSRLRSWPFPLLNVIVGPFSPWEKVECQKPART